MCQTQQSELIDAIGDSRSRLSHVVEATSAVPVLPLHDENARNPADGGTSHKMTSVTRFFLSDANTSL